MKINQLFSIKNISISTLISHRCYITLSINQVISILNNSRVSLVHESICPICVKDFSKCKTKNLLILTKNSKKNNGNKRII